MAYAEPQSRFARRVFKIRRRIRYDILMWWRFKAALRHHLEIRRERKALKRIERKYRDKIDFSSWPTREEFAQDANEEAQPHWNSLKVHEAAILLQRAHRRGVSVPPHWYENRSNMNGTALTDVGDREIRAALRADQNQRLMKWLAVAGVLIGFITLFVTTLRK